jgi:hypothetical protein
MDHLGLVESDYRLGQCVVVGIADATHRRLSLRFGQAFGIANRQILAASIAVMDDALGFRA